MSSRKGVFLSAAGAAALVAAALSAACGSDDTAASRFDGGAMDAGDDLQLVTDGIAPVDAQQGPYSDFPQDPIVVSGDGGAGAPNDSSTLFGDPDGGAGSGGPCLVEPEVGALYPQNWLRPRFHWIAPGGENLFEVRVHADNQQNDLVVYTTSTIWTMPKALWDGLRMHSADVPMTIRVRGGVFDGKSLTAVALGSTGPIGIAPVEAPGSVVYWTTKPNPLLKGFSIGDETVGDVLTPSQVYERGKNGVACIGCHASTPDGKYAGAVVLQSNPNNNSIAGVEQGNTGNPPPFLAAGGKAAIDSMQGVPAYSKAHWGSGDYMELLLSGKNLAWVQLDAAQAGQGNAWDVLARSGDGNAAAMPTWSHDGNTIVYVSTKGSVPDGRVAAGPMDLFSVPYNNRAGGAAKPVAGASDPDAIEYYPAFSPDDAWLVFNKVAGASSSAYNNAAAEVYLVPSAGGTATRLAANDPPACTGKKSPGVTNSWAKWAPSVGKTKDGRSFYWIVFSSTRDENGNPQLYVSPVVVDGKGKVTTYPALYLWNQPADENNHTPAWDVFKIPPPPPPN